MKDRETNKMVERELGYSLRRWSAHSSILLILTPEKDGGDSRKEIGTNPPNQYETDLEAKTFDFAF
jgi:hypothetical protein